MKNRKIAMGITAAAMAGFIGLASVYGASVSAQIRAGRNGSETETEETESETEIIWNLVEELFDAEAKNTAMDTGATMMMEAAESDGALSYWVEPTVLNWKDAGGCGPDRRNDQLFQL